MLLHIAGIDSNGFSIAVGRHERNFVKHTLHDRLQPPGSNIFHSRIDGDGDVRKRMGSGVTEIVPHQAFETADGHVMVAAGNDNLFRTLATLLERPELSSDPRFATNSRRVENRHTLIPLLQAIFHERPTAEWLAKLDSAGVPAARLTDARPFTR